MNPELLNQAAEKVGNVKTLINIVSRRVRQLSFGGGGISRPLIASTANLGMADIALREIIEEKIGWELPEAAETPKPVVKRSRKPKTDRAH
jgi:DNA-directed RNA polymerase subunit K/omega